MSVICVNATGAGGWSFTTGAGPGVRLAPLVVLASATKSLAIEYASRGIRVNAVSPGIIQTPEQPPESYHALAGLHPLQRVGQVSDIVDGILFLESSPFITGEILHIDGGQIAGH